MSRASSKGKRGQHPDIDPALAPTGEETVDHEGKFAWLDFDDYVQLTAEEAETFMASGHFQPIDRSRAPEIPVYSVEQARADEAARQRSRRCV